MGEKSRFNMVVPENQKQRWEGHVEENPDIISLSQLVRQAVEAEIARDTTPDMSGSSNEVIQKRLSDLLQNTKKIRADIEAIEDRLNYVEQKVENNPEISKLASDVFEILPSKQKITKYYQIPREKSETGSGKVDEFARRLGEDQSQIKEAIEKLQNEIALVHTTDKFGDEPRYYKKK